MLPKSCCCCIPLRSGMIVLGILIIISNLVSAILAIVSDHNYLSIIPMVLGLVTGIALLVGAFLENKTLLFVALTLYAIMILVEIVFIILVVADITILNPKFKDDCKELVFDRKNTTCEEQKQFTMIAKVISGVVSVLLNGYFWICALSFYLQVKREDETFN